jgi:hypothetical protein
MKNVLMLFALTAFLIGCAEGSALLVGQARGPIEDFNSVVILTEMPDGAEQIAIVKASSDDGWTQQQSLDYAVEELKRQAAKVGANAVVLTSRETGTQVVGIPQYGGGTMVGSSEVEIVEGVAVYVQ